MANRITQVINNKSYKLSDAVERTDLIRQVASETDDWAYLNEVILRVTDIAHFNFAKMRYSWAKSPKVLAEALKLAADEGDLDAQYNLGCSYLYGANGVKIDTREAVKCFELAADRSDSDAQYNLGCIYRYRFRIIPEAIKWFTPLAEQGDSRAQHELDIINRAFKDPKEWKLSR